MGLPILPNLLRWNLNKRCVKQGQSGHQLEHTWAQSSIATVRHAPDMVTMATLRLESQWKTVTREMSVCEYVHTYRVLHTHVPIYIQINVLEGRSYGSCICMRWTNKGKKTEQAKETILVFNWRRAVEGNADRARPLPHLLTAKTARATARMANATITMTPRIAPTAEPVSDNRKRFIHGATHSHTANAETLHSVHAVPCMRSSGQPCMEQSNMWG